jgi:D-cysteine desulfhydrase
MFNHLFDIKKRIKIQQIEKTLNSRLKACFDVARFDELDPDISGNKFFKLKYNIESAILQEKKGLLTMGGAYSNHLAATARACSLYGLKSIGIVRGEIPNTLNHTLSYCQSQDMGLLSVRRSSFDREDETIQALKDQYQDFLFIPMGGANEDGIKGAAEMADMVSAFETYDIIICSIGTGTMFRGLKQRIQKNQLLVGIPAMKLSLDEEQNFIDSLIGKNAENQFQIISSFAGNGFGRVEPEIIRLMNETYKEFDLPLDFVYTGKLLNALYALIIQGEIDPMKKILFIHSGGLQGNLSLPPSTLIF